MSYNYWFLHQSIFIFALPKSTINDDPNIYSEINVLVNAFKVFTRVSWKRVKPSENKLNLISLNAYWSQQFKSTLIASDQFVDGGLPSFNRLIHNRTMSHRLKNTPEKIIDKRHFCVGFKAAFDSTTGSRSYNAKSQFGIPIKLLRLCKLTLNKTST